MRPPLHFCKESRIFARVPAYIKEVSLACSECVCVCVCVYTNFRDRQILRKPKAIGKC